MITPQKRLELKAGEQLTLTTSDPQDFTIHLAQQSGLELIQNLSTHAAARNLHITCGAHSTLRLSVIAYADASDTISDILPLNLTCVLEEGSQATVGMYQQTGLYTSGRFEFILKGDASKVDFMSASRLNNVSQLRQFVDVSHLGRSTTSNVEFRSVLFDQAKSIFDSTILVASNATKTDAQQRVRSLLLSPKAFSNHCPKLEINTDEVKCAHGATISPVSKDQLYYLTSRGISPAQAERMIVNGFLNLGPHSEVLQDESS